MSNYILIDGEPVLEPDSTKWAEWFEKQDGGARTVASDAVAGARISTVFLGIDHNFTSKGPPVLWETMIFGGPISQEYVRYTSKTDALAGHAVMVKRVQASEWIVWKCWRFVRRIFTGKGGA